jgi:hypothetical protein
MVNALTSGVSDAAISAQGLSGCVIDDCGKRIVGRGRCRRHYQQWWKATRNTARPPALNLKTKTPEQRFQEKIDQRGTDDCWPWLASTVNGGHGEFFVSPQRGKIPAHSYALELASGQPCPPGMEACHRCDNPPCCNPTHSRTLTTCGNAIASHSAARGGTRGSPRPRLSTSGVDA